MLPLTRENFYAQAESKLHKSVLTDPQKAGYCVILGYARQNNIQGCFLAYVLATVFHETGRTIQPVRETFAKSDNQAILNLNAAYKRGQLTWVKKPYWLLEGGHSYFGRGLVQITHRENYERLGKALGFDLVNSPELCLNLNVATQILFKGMLEGLFTGKKLDDYIDEEDQNWIEARHIINGTDCAEKIAGYAKLYYDIISKFKDQVIP